MEKGGKGGGAVARKTEGDDIRVEGVASGIDLSSLGADAVGGVALQGHSGHSFLARWSTDTVRPAVGFDPNGKRTYRGLEFNLVFVRGLGRGPARRAVRATAAAAGRKFQEEGSE